MLGKDYMDKPIMQKKMDEYRAAKDVTHSDDYVSFLLWNEAKKTRFNKE